MADTNETIADIIAEIRALSNPISDGIIAINGRIIADRLEAALKRECGHAAKLRKALELFAHMNDDGFYDKSPVVCSIVNKARAALAAPATSENSSAVGNMAAMREALVQCELFLGNVSRHGHPTLNPGDKCTACDGVDELRGMVVRALAEPMRNCDRFATLPDAIAAWRDVDPREAGPFDLWLFDTAKEGGAK